MTATPSALPTWRTVVFAPLATPEPSLRDLREHDVGELREREPDAQAVAREAREQAERGEVQRDRPEHEQQADLVDHEPGSHDLDRAEAVDQPAAELRADDHEQSRREHPQAVVPR